MIAPSRLPRLPLVLLLLPPVLTLGLIVRFGVDLPYWDEWVHLQTVVSQADGRLTAGELFAQYNESRKVFPRLVIITLAHLTGGDQRAQMLLSWLLACGTLWGVQLLAKRSGLPRYFTPLASVLLFSIVQWQNWLWGIQFVCFTPLACLVAILVLSGGRLGDRSPALLVVLCAALCLVATYSYANGMLLFPLAAFALRANPAARTRAHLLPFAGIAVLAIGLYFADYARPVWTPTLGDSLSRPILLAGYFVALIGGPLAPSEVGTGIGVAPVALPIALGTTTLVLLGLGMPRAWREQRGASTAWVIIALYSLVSLATTSAGRSPFGIDNALLSRYCTFALPLLVATVALLSLGSWRKTAAMAALLAGILTAIGSVHVLPKVAEVSQRQLAGRVMLHFCMTAPDATGTTLVADYPQHPLIVPTAVRLSQRGLLSPPISPDGDLRPLLRERTGGEAEYDAVAVVVAEPDGVLRVRRVLLASQLAGGLPPLPPGASLYGVRGTDLTAFPLPPR